MQGSLYVGNLPQETSGEALRAMLEECGTVLDVKIRPEREAAGQRRSAVVTMVSDTAAQRAVSRFDGVLFQGRSLQVSLLEGRTVLEAAHRPAAPAPAPAARELPNRRPFVEKPMAPEPRERTNGKRGGDGAKRPAVRITQQFRERRSMTYELDCSGVPLVVRMFFPEEVERPAPEQWVVEVRSNHALDADVATATAPSRAQALQRIVQGWHENDASRTPSPVDWQAVLAAMTEVRAI